MNVCVCVLDTSWGAVGAHVLVCQHVRACQCQSIWFSFLQGICNSCKQDDKARKIVLLHEVQRRELTRSYKELQECSYFLYGRNLAWAQRSCEVGGGWRGGGRGDSLIFLRIASYFLVCVRITWQTGLISNLDQFTMVHGCTNPIGNIPIVGSYSRVLGCRADCSSSYTQYAHTCEPCQ